MSYLKHTAFITALVLGGAGASAGSLQGQTDLDPDPPLLWLASAEADGMPGAHIDVLAESFERTLAASGDAMRVEDRFEAGSDAGLPPIAARSVMLRPPREVARVRRPADELPMFERRQDRRGVPWIIAGSALVVGGAIVGDDVGTILMAGGVGVTAYGLFIYF